MIKIFFKNGNPLKTLLELLVVNCFFTLVVNILGK